MNRVILPLGIIAIAITAVAVWRQREADVGRIAVVERRVDEAARARAKAARQAVRRHRALLCDAGRLVSVSSVASPERLSGEGRAHFRARRRTVTRFYRGLRKINCKRLGFTAKRKKRRGGGSPSPGSSPVPQPRPPTGGGQKPKPKPPRPTRPPSPQPPSQPKPPGRAPGVVCQLAPQVCK